MQVAFFKVSKSSTSPRIGRVIPFPNFLWRITGFPSRKYDKYKKSPCGKGITRSLREQQLHPRKLTCPQKRDDFNRKYIFQPSFFRGYVKLPGGNHDYLPLGMIISKKPRLGASLAVLSALLSALPNVFYERLLKEAAVLGDGDGDW